MGLFMLRAESIASPSRAAAIMKITVEKSAVLKMATQMIRVAIGSPMMKVMILLVLSVCFGRLYHGYRVFANWSGRGVFLGS